MTTPTPDQLPPHSDEAEAGCLGCILCEPAQAAPMTAQLQPEDFYDLRHRQIFQAMLKILDRKGLPDTMAVWQQLKDEGAEQSSGGLFYLGGLPDQIPSAFHFDTYLATVKDKHLRRQLIAKARNVSELAWDTALPVQTVVRASLAQLEPLCLASSTARLVEFLAPGDILRLPEDPSLLLLGDQHIKKGATFVLGGAPGVGKSRMVIDLAIAGAQGRPWFGLPVHRPFKTMILQAENGLSRLRADFQEQAVTGLDEAVRVCRPPELGFALHRPDFKAALRQSLEEFAPDVLVLDPWNRLAQDDKMRDYLLAYEQLLAVLPPPPQAPALGIVAHTRKPKDQERANGRSLLHLLAGSYLLGSVPRAVFVAQSASDDPEDHQVVFTCAKNNDGQLGAPSAWRRCPGGFAPVKDFDWDAFHNPARPQRRTVTEEDLRAVFGEGTIRLARKQAVAALQERTGLGHSLCYRALSKEGKFAPWLREAEGLLSWAGE